MIQVTGQKFFSACIHLTVKQAYADRSLKGNMKRENVSRTNDRTKSKKIQCHPGPEKAKVQIRPVIKLCIIGTITITIKANSLEYFAKEDFNI